MPSSWGKYISYICLFIFFQNQLSAESGRYRCMWRDDPSTTMVIGWEQFSGMSPTVYYDEFDGGRNSKNYSFSQKPDRKIRAKGMHNYFVRLSNLKPNTVYYFIIEDSEGASRQLSFKTAPDNPYERLSLIAGGDSRNHRKARQKANSLVAKLRPHAVMFGGDMTGGDIERQWKAWFDDWQNTITPDGHMTPIIATRGNHESSNKSLVDLFDIKNEKIYYALNLGGSLLRIYTLNSMIASGGDQRDWLENDLSQHTHMKWKFTQYHHAIRPHCSKKHSRNKQLKYWATLFHKYGVDLSCESDSHVAKTTYPIRPSKERGSEEGFIRDDVNGTVYVGEGCWGAPLRRNDDDKSWTRASGSFNQFKWIFVDLDGVEVRTIKIDNAEEVASVSEYDIFSEPARLDVWEPSTGRVLYIRKQQPLAEYSNTNRVNYPRTHQERTKVKEPLLKKPSSLEEPNDFVAMNKLKKTSKIEERKTPKRRAKKESRLLNVNPIEIYQFIAKVESNEVVVQWITKNEHLRHIFEIQRSIDGLKYVTFARIQGTGIYKKGKENLYKVRDNLNRLANGIIPKYRLKHVKGNGEVLLLQARVAINDGVKWNKYDKLKTDPRTGQLKFKYKLQQPADVSIRLVNTSQQPVLMNEFKNVNGGNFLQSIDISKIKNGDYLLIIEANQKVIRQYKVENRI